MKIVNLILSSLFFMLLVSCKTYRIHGEEKNNGLDKMLDCYYYYFGDYPSSMNELIVFSNHGYYDSSFIDTANMTIRYLTQIKDEIIWQLDDEFPNNHLLIYYSEDTLAFRINDNRFPSLNDFIYSYTDCYGCFPSNVHSLIEFRKAALEVTKFNHFWQYDSLTIRNIQKCQDLGILSWTITEKDFIIKIDDDTIASWTGHEQKSGFCHTLPEEISFFSPRFFDSEDIYVFCDENLYESFRHRIIELYYKKRNETNDGIDRWCIVQYTKDGGVESLCNDVDISTNNAWNNMIFDFVNEFAEKNNFSKIIFSCPGLQ